MGKSIIFSFLHQFIHNEAEGVCVDVGGERFPTVYLRSHVLQCSYSDADGNIFFTKILAFEKETGSNKIVALDSTYKERVFSKSGTVAGRLREPQREKDPWLPHAPDVSLRQYVREDQRQDGL